MFFKDLKSRFYTALIQISHFVQLGISDFGQRQKIKKWWIQGDSNPRPPRCERGALPTEL